MNALPCSPSRRQGGDNGVNFPGSPQFMRHCGPAHILYCPSIILLSQFMRHCGPAHILYCRSFILLSEYYIIVPVCLLYANFIQPKCCFLMLMPYALPLWIISYDMVLISAYGAHATEAGPLSSGARVCRSPLAAWLLSPV
eukprot:361940-Chlamydomonas_euryale.AAC.6